MEIKIHQQQAQPHKSNPCGESCSFPCLASPKIVENSAVFTCSCPDGWRKDKSNAQSCLPVDTGIVDVVSVNKGSKDQEPTPTPSPADDDLLSKDAHPGRVAGIVIGVILILILVIFAVAVTLFVWRRLMKRGIKSLNFDNPVYRRTTESDDTFSLEKHQYHPGGSMHSFASSMEPLTGSGTGNQC